MLQSNIDTFPKYGELYGYSPFREVQLLIDGKLAGVTWPYPVIFTGGVVPGLWRPNVGIDAFDLKEDEIDITPWLPVLCDGSDHNFTIQILGLVDDGNGKATLSEPTSSYWLVTGKVFLWLGEDGHVTTGAGPHILDPTPKFQVSSTIIKTRNGANDTLLYEVRAERRLSIISIINTSRGDEVASWHQHLIFSNSGNFSNRGHVEINKQHTLGYEASSSGYARQFAYPLFVYSDYETYKDNFSISARVENGKDVKILGQPVFPTGLELLPAIEARYPTYQGSWLSTTQSGEATFLANETSQTSFSYGTTEQDFSIHGVRVDLLHHFQTFPPIDVGDEIFQRHVEAVNGTVIEDDELLNGKDISRKRLRSQLEPAAFCLSNVPGRGSPWPPKS